MFINKYYFVINFLFALVVIISGFSLQYVLGYIPCYLCIVERWPYICLLFLSIAGIFYKKTWIVFTISLVMFISILLAGYHVGVEQEWWEEPSYCKKTFIKFSENNVIGDLDKLPILHQSCKESSPRIMNISLPEMNFLFSMVLFTMSIIYRVKYSSANNIKK